MLTGLIVGAIVGAIVGTLFTALCVSARGADDQAGAWEPDDTRQVRLVMEEALGRLEAGREKYGVFDPETDIRDLFAEAEQEDLDGINYRAMDILKRRVLKQRLLEHVAQTMEEADTGKPLIVVNADSPEPHLQQVFCDILAKVEL